MPRPERSLDPSAGPVQRLAADLRELRRAVGSPSYRELAGRCGYSVTTLSDAAGGYRLPALPVLRAYVQACFTDPAEWESRWRAISVELTQACDNGATADPPYLGLASFRPADAERFFGRERLVAELAERARAGGLLAVVGASGSGKSSLLRAGLVPALAGSGPYRLLTPGPRPMEAYAAQPDAAVTFVDQFEEIFTQCPDESQRARFVEELLAATGTVVLALRADFYGHCARYPRLVAVLGRATALVGPMSDEELGRAVTGPAALAGLSVERALVTKVIADAGGQAGALPMVSHALLETWRHRQGRLLTLATYEAAGGVAGAIAHTAEQVYDGFDETERRVTRQILTRLTTLGDATGDTRRRVDRSELDFDGADVVVDRLARARLLVVDEHTVEIAHEALIAAWPRLRGWLTEDRDALRVHRQLTDAAAIWRGLGREPGALYRGARLATAREWLARDALTGLEREYLDASLAAETAERHATERRSRQLRLLSAGLAILLVLAVLGGGAGLWQWRIAAGQGARALSRQLASQAQATAPTDAAEAMRLSLAAHRSAATVESGSALLSLASRHAYSGRLPHGGLVKDVAFSPDGTVLATACQDGRITLWDAAGRVERTVLTGHDGAVRALAYEPGGARLVSGGLDGAVIVWDLARASEATRIRGHKGAVDAVAFSPDGTLVASAGEDRRVLLWRAADGTPAGELSGSSGRRPDLAFSPDGRHLVAAGDDGTTVVWDVASRNRIRTLEGRLPVYAAAYSPDGALIATAGEERDIVLWNAATGARVATLIGHTAAVRALAFTRDGTTLVSGGDDEVAAVWDVARGGLLTRLTGHTSQLYGVAVSPDGRIVASAGRDRSALLWDRADLPLTGALSEVLNLTVTADGQWLAATVNDGTAVSWDLGRRRQRTALKVASARPAPAGPAGGTAGPPAVGSDHSGQLMVTRTGTEVLLWDPVTGAPVRWFTGHTDRVLDTALDPRGRLLAGGAANGKVLVWDTGSGALVGRFEQSRQVQRMQFTNDGRTLVAASRDGTVTFWDVATRTTRKVLRTRVDAADAALTGDGMLLAVGGAGGEISVWDTRRDRRVATLAGHSGPVDTLAFSPDGRTLASGGQDRTVLLWDVSTRQLQARLFGHGAGVQAAAWSPTGDVLYTGGADHIVIPWAVRLDRARERVCRDLAEDFHHRPAECRARQGGSR